MDGLIVDGSKGDSFLKPVSKNPSIEISYILCLTIIRGIPTRKGSYKIRLLMRIFSTRKYLLHQETEVSSTLL